MSGLETRMAKKTRIPAEVFPLAEYLSEEMQARGWTTTDVAIQMGGSCDAVAKNLLAVDLIMCVHSDRLLVGDDLFRGLARAFDVHEDFLRALDATWRQWPDRRSPFEPPDTIFGPISRRSLIRAIT